MIDSQMPWLSMGASSTDLDSSSSLSLLHSIYGSQASQLPFSESEASITGTRSEVPLTPASAVDWRRRPKSSPAATLASRGRERHQLRPEGDAGRSTTLRSRRPASSAPRRPPSAVPGRKGSGARPKTALGVPVSLSLEEGSATVIRDTAPVSLTRTPEYFNFWEGKPLLERDYGVEVHRRKAWSRPKSDYGSRFYARRGNKHRGKGGEAVGLETLVEHEGSTLGNGEGVGDQEEREREDEDLSKVDMFSDLSAQQIVLGNLSLTNQNQGDSNGLSDGVEGGEDEGVVENGGDEGGVENEGDGDGVEGGDGGDMAGEDEGDHDVEGGGDEGSVGGGDEEGVEDGGDEEGMEDGGDGGGVENGGDRGGMEGGGDVEGRGDSGDDKRHSKGRGDHDSWQRSLKDRWAKKKGEWETGGSRSEPVRNGCFGKKALVSASWMDGGRSSNRNTRFELPMDMLQLEGMSPLQYLRNHTVISKSRMTHCSKVFTELDKDRDSQINSNDLVLGMIEVFNHRITEDQARSTLEVAQLPNNEKVDVHLFAAICCLAERMHSLYFLPIARREVIEAVDFEGLEWKLRACTIRPTLRTLFAQL